SPEATVQADQPTKPPRLRLRLSPLQVSSDDTVDLFRPFEMKEVTDVGHQFADKAIRKHFVHLCGGGVAYASIAVAVKVKARNQDRLHANPALQVHMGAHRRRGAERESVVGKGGVSDST